MDSVTRLVIGRSGRQPSHNERIGLSGVGLAVGASSSGTGSQLTYAGNLVRFIRLGLNISPPSRVRVGRGDGPARNTARPRVRVRREREPSLQVPGGGRLAHGRVQAAGTQLRRPVSI